VTQRGLILNLTREQVRDRVLSQVVALPAPPPGTPLDAGNRPIAYRLEGGWNGGFDPTADHCASWSYGARTPTADCIGLALWGSGIDRKQPGYKGSRGEWLNCASLLDDADGAQVYCRGLGTHESPLPGDWLLTRDHIGVIVRPPVPNFDELVVDCSPRHGRQHAVGIGGPWSDACRVIRPKHYKEDE
jgi:hypothetical protein